MHELKVCNSFCSLVNVLHAMEINPGDCTNIPVNGKHLGIPKIKYPENLENCYGGWKSGTISAKGAMVLTEPEVEFFWIDYVLRGIIRRRNIRKWVLLMCGRYYIDDDTAREIEKLVRQVDKKMRQTPAASSSLQAKDIHPSEVAPVIAAEGQNLCCRWLRWGFPGFHGKQLIFNARSESVLEKKMFRESAEQRRIAVPAAWFYEWNKKKEKNIFYRKGQPILYMAGLYNRYQDEDRFVILTTEANDSMRPVHGRMPLVLERDEIQQWLNEDQLVESFLKKMPPLLERQTDFEQMSLFDSDNS